MNKHKTDTDLDRDGAPLEEKTTTAEPLTFSQLSHEELTAKLNETEAQLNEAKLAVEEHKNQLLRNHAELDNIRKRANKDVQNAHKYGAEQLVLSLLPVVDSLERGMTIEIGDNEFAKQIHAGLEMTLKLLMDTLEKSAVKPVDPLGKAFDPALHQAISMQEDVNAEANTVLQVLQKGYQLQDRLIRPALVIVAKQTRLLP
jgi:molecular chaperone GrpE